MLVFVLDLAAFGPAYGAIAWFGHLSIGAWSIVAWLCVRAGRRAHSVSMSKPPTVSKGED